MKSKILILISTLILIFLISLSGASAYYPYLYDYGLHPRYHYYENDNSYPIVTGPFPRGYLFHRDMDKDIDFVHDDFGHYDDFIGYKDLDIFYPDQGIIEVIRNPNAREADWDLSHIPDGMKTFGNKVYGYIPGPDGTWAMYRKHYHHEHPWDLEVNEYEYGYGYGYGYEYYTPFPAYRNKPIKPIYTNNCQSMSACQYRYCADCYR